MNNKSIVSLLKCTSYSDGLNEAIAGVLKPLGGPGGFIRPGQSVLIKPNLLTDRRPEQAVTTHPEVVRQIVRLVRECGGNPSIGDSPASAVKLEKVWDTCGFRKMADEENVPLLNLEKSGSREVTVDGYRFSIAQPVLDADLVINVPKVKTHSFTVLTCAIKNMYGTLPGYQKAHQHRNHPNPKSFCSYLSALFKAVRPGLTVVDGILGMEGNGPSAGTPVQLGFLAASANAPALDMIICRILGIDPAAVHYLTPFMPEIMKEEIDIAGCMPEELAPASFKVPGTFGAGMVPDWISRLMGPFFWVRPDFSDKCISCGLCAKSCPVNAIEIKPGARPLLNKQACIGCCCCHEICPEHAVTMMQSPFLNFIRKGKML